MFGEMGLGSGRRSVRILSRKRIHDILDDCRYGLMVFCNIENDEDIPCHCAARGLGYAMTMNQAVLKPCLKVRRTPESFYMESSPA
jgi:hypothetical protein